MKCKLQQKFIKGYPLEAYIVKRKRNNNVFTETLTQNTEFMLKQFRTLANQIDETKATTSFKLSREHRTRENCTTEEGQIVEKKNPNN